MIDLCIAGHTEESIFDFTIGTETKTIDPNSKSIHFGLESNQNYRVHFEQKFLPGFSPQIETILNILFLPIRGLFNIISFNADSQWEKEISAFRISGYFDITLKENTSLSFQFSHGYFDKAQSYFHTPKITFSPQLRITQENHLDLSEIKRKHFHFLQNVASVSIWFLCLFLFLLNVSVKEKIPFAIAFLSFILFAFLFLIGFVVIRSFITRKSLTFLLLNQKSK